MNLGKGGKFTWVFYDSFEGDGSATSATLFTVPIGSSSKTKYMTNMRLAGQLSVDSGFAVQALACGSTPFATAANLQKWLEGYFEFYIGGELCYEGILFTVPAGYGIVWVPDSASAGTSNYAQNGQPNARNLLTLNRELEIKAGEEIRVDCVWQTAPTDDERFWFFLIGEYQKPLQ